MEQEDMQNPLIALAVKFGQDAFQGILKKADFDKDGELDFTDPDGEGPKVAEVPAMFDRIGHAAENMARLRQIGLNLLKRETTRKVGIKTKRLRAGWDDAYMMKLLQLAGHPGEAGDA